MTKPFHPSTTITTFLDHPHWTAMQSRDHGDAIVARVVRCQTPPMEMSSLSAVNTELWTHFTCTITTFLGDGPPPHTQSGLTLPLPGGPLPNSPMFMCQLAANMIKGYMDPPDVHRCLTIWL